MPDSDSVIVHEKDINYIIWKGPIANHSFVAILPSLRNIDLQGVSLRLNAAEVDRYIYIYDSVFVVLFILVCTTSIHCAKILGVLEVLAAHILVKVVLRIRKY